MTTTASQALVEVSTAAPPAKGGHPATVIRRELEAAAAEIAMALPGEFPGGPDRFRRIVMTAVNSNPDLLKCSARSVIGAAMQAAQLGLTPNLLGEAWIVPYRDAAGFQVGVKGLVQLAARAGIRLRAHTVYDGDEFEYELGLEPRLVHKPRLGAARGQGIYWYAVAHDATGGGLHGFAVLDRAAVERRRAFSKAPNSGAWKDSYDEMALGKAIREVCRFLPLSTEMATALASDGTVRDRIAGDADEFVTTYDDESDGD